MNFTKFALLLIIGLAFITLITNGKINIFHCKYLIKFVHYKCFWNDFIFIFKYVFNENILSLI